MRTTRHSVTRFIRVLGILAIGLAVMVGGSSVASATNLTGLTTGTNSTISFRQYYLGTQFHNAFHHTDSNDIEPTDIRTDLYGHGGGLEREVNVYDYASASGDYGWATCVSASGATCWQWTVVMNQSFTYTDRQAESLMCEEIGHSVGLDHRFVDGTCMSQQFDEYHIDTHDHNHLDALY